jgi:hypothetical protein
MPQTPSLSSLQLIETEKLKEDEELLFSINYEMYPKKEVNIFKKKKHLAVHRKSWNPLKKAWASDQMEIPLIALPWIIDCFENGFLKSHQDGGLSDFERSQQKEFNGELIGINAMMHCCAENLPGFNIWNGSRKSYIAISAEQQWDIPRYILIDGLLNQLKSISQKYS